MDDKDFSLAEQRERIEANIMARKENKQKNRQQQGRQKISDFCLKDEGDTNSGASTTKGVSRKKTGPKTQKTNLNAKKSKGNQVFDLIIANAKDKGDDDEPYYYQIHCKDAIERCNDYWKDKDYKNLEHRMVWIRHNHKLPENKPKIWGPLQEAQIRDTEFFWRYETRDDVLQESNTSRWEAENKTRAAKDEQPLDRDRVRPWSEIPMYVPCDHMGDLPPLGMVLGRTSSDDRRFDDREIRLATTRDVDFPLTPDVDARPILDAQAEKWKNAQEATGAAGKKDTTGTKNATDKKDSSDKKGFVTPAEWLGRDGEEIFQADAPKNSISSNANLAAAIEAAFANRILTAANPNGTGKADNSTPSDKIAAEIRSVKIKIAPKATDAMIAALMGVVGVMPRSYAVSYLELGDGDIERAVNLFYDGGPIPAQPVDDKMDVDDEAFGTTGGGTDVWNGTNATITKDGKGEKDGPWTAYDDEKAQKKE